MVRPARSKSYKWIAIRGWRQCEKTQSTDQSKRKNSKLIDNRRTTIAITPATCHGKPCPLLKRISQAAARPAASNYKAVVTSPPSRTWSTRNSTLTLISKRQLSKCQIAAYSRTRNLIGPRTKVAADTVRPRSTWNGTSSNSGVSQVSTTRSRRSRPNSTGLMTKNWGKIYEYLNTKNPINW